MIEYFKNGKILYAIIIDSSYKQDGINFFTPNNFSQQLGYMNRPKGYKIPPHYHNVIKREVKLTNEVLFIKSGKVKVNFYDENQTYLENRILKKGDIILLAKGGHGFEMLEKSEILEIKQGPYAGDEDKTRFSET
jgi:hypothetical protein